MKKYLSCYFPGFATALVYMLQATEYDLGEYLAWFWRAPDMRHVARRHQLKHTAKAKLLLLAARLCLIVLVTAAVISLWLGWSSGIASGWFGLSLVIVAVLPIATVYALALPLWLGRLLVQRPRERSMISRAAAMIQNHPGVRIAIAGSYGKTTFKETLATVLGSGKTVAATPGNMNTPIGISRFAATLSGHEDILIFELGEYYPGDVKKLCELTRPQIGIITGINEAHLDKFKTLDRTVATIFELADFLDKQPVYKNGENQLVRDHAPNDPLLYSRKGLGDWSVSDIKIKLTGTSFIAKNSEHTIHVHSGLLGAQQIGPLVACIDIALRLGLTPEQVTKGLAATTPYEHRMQPRHVAGATVIDDTYNGNSDGIHAGLEWLGAVPAKRRLYVTPGLVEQGSRTAVVHEQIGREIARTLTTPSDIVVLMHNSTTHYIEKGLKEGKFSGQLDIIEDPVRFYSNLDQFVAAGDVVLMQNDWSDNYA